PTDGRSMMRTPRRCRGVLLVGSPGCRMDRADFFRRGRAMSGLASRNALTEGASREPCESLLWPVAFSGRSFYMADLGCALRLAVRTAPSHGANRGSIPLGRTNKIKCLAQMPFDASNNRRISVLVEPQVQGCSDSLRG